jgi:hypothetical protein
MPFITLAEQGIRPPEQVIQEAANNAVNRRALTQRTEQDALSFPFELQRKRSDAETATAEAAAVNKTIQLKQVGQELINRHQALQNQFLIETDPTRKQKLGIELETAKAQLQNFELQAHLIEAQMKDTEKRGQLTDEEIADRKLKRASTTVSPGKLDPYGNQILTTTRTDDTGKVLNTQQSFEQGRGTPRIAYKSVFDEASGMMKRVPGVLETDSQTGEVSIRFQDDPADAAGQETSPDPLLKDIVEEFFDSETGKRNNKKPSSAVERAQLSSLLRNSGQLQAYGLDAYADNAGVFAKPAVSASSSTAAPADGPQAGISTGGAPVKTGEDAGAAKPSGGVKIQSGRKQEPAAAPKKTFKDLPVGAVFLQNGKQFKKTGDTSAEPVDGL